jgi:zinc transporter ZupT
VQIAHKIFDGLAVGASIYPAKFTMFQSMCMMGFCAVMMPVGMAIGWGSIEGSNDHSKLAEAVILSLSAGSFLFISLTELLPSALHDGRWMLFKIGGFFIGWLALCVLAGYV